MAPPIAYPDTMSRISPGVHHFAHGPWNPRDVCSVRCFASAWLTSSHWSRFWGGLSWLSCDSWRFRLVLGWSIVHCLSEN
ncbi:hypothetical protein BJX62DRAFT_51065 [Aspergillus germanicus]